MTGAGRQRKIRRLRCTQAMWREPTGGRACGWARGACLPGPTRRGVHAGGRCRGSAGCGRPAALARRTASGMPWVKGSPWPGSNTPAVTASRAIQRGYRLGAAHVQRGWHDLRADPAGVGIPGAHGITCQERIALFHRDGRAARSVTGRVQGPRRTRHVDDLPVREGGDLLDRDNLHRTAAGQRERGAVERIAQQIGQRAAFVLPAGLAGPGRLGVRLVNPASAGLSIRGMPLLRLGVSVLRMATI